MEQKKHIYMNEGFSDFPSYVERSSPKPKLLLIFIIVFLLIVAALAGLYFLGANKNNDFLASFQAAPTPTQALAPTQPPVPTTAPTEVELDRTALTVAILNGSGTPGAAKGVSSTLSGLGYKVGTVGNADKFTYEGLTIHIKKAKSQYLKQLQTDLEKDNPNASISASVQDSITTDAEVIVGK